MQMARQCGLRAQETIAGGRSGGGARKEGNAAASWPRCQLLAHWKALGKMENCARRKSAYKCMYLGPPAG